MSCERLAQDRKGVAFSLVIHYRMIWSSCPMVISPRTFTSCQFNSPTHGQAHYRALAAREDRVTAFRKLTSWAETIMGRTEMDECPGRARFSESQHSWGPWSPEVVTSGLEGAPGAGTQLGQLRAGVVRAAGRCLSGEGRGGTDTRL